MSTSLARVMDDPFRTARFATALFPSALWSPSLMGGQSASAIVMPLNEAEFD